MNLFSDQIPLLKPWIEEEEIQAVAEVLRSGWISQGPKVRQFEHDVTTLIGAPFGVAVNSATSALHLAFQVAGLEPGDKVVVPAHTCMATLNGILLAGGRPVFADIDRRTFNLDPAAVESVLDDEVRAVCVVHQIGLSADLVAFQRLAKRHDLLLIEDAATAFGGMYAGSFLGAHGQPTVYSFHPRKMISTGEGGMVLLWNESQAEQAQRLRSAGADVSDLVRHQMKGVLQQTYPTPGYNYRMTDFQAALGIVQLGRLGQMLEQRAAQARFYDAALAELAEVLPPFVPAYAKHCYTSYCVTLPGANSETIGGILDFMAEHGVSCRRGIQPLHHEAYFEAAYGQLDLPHTEAAAKETLFLPIYPGLTREQQEQVVRWLKVAITKRRLPSYSGSAGDSVQP